jgi:hypothetical protein
LNRLNQLRAFAETTSNRISRQEEQVAESRTHVQASQRYIQQLQPWIEQSEKYLQKRFDQNGAASLNDAKQLFEKHKVNIKLSNNIRKIFRSFQEFLEERRRMLTIYNSLLDEDHDITDQHEVKSLIKSLSNRWSEIVRKSDELSSRYDAQYRSWSSFDSESNSFRDQVLSEFEQRVHTIVSTDANKLFDLNRINVFLNEIRV